MYCRKTLFQTDRTIASDFLFSSLRRSNYFFRQKLTKVSEVDTIVIVFFSRRFKTYLVQGQVPVYLVCRFLFSSILKREIGEDPRFPVPAVEILAQTGTMDVEKLLGFGWIGPGPETFICCFSKKKQVGRERHFHDSFILHIIRILSRMDRCMIVDLYKGSAWVEIYTSAPSRVIAFKQVDISGPFDLVTNRIGAMPSSAGKRQAECQFSAFVSVSLEL